MIVAEHGILAVSGTRESPTLRLRPATPEQDDFAKHLAGSRWVQSRSSWSISKVGPRFFDKAARLGLELLIDPRLGEDERTVRMPLASLAPNGREVHIALRLSDYDETLELAGWGAFWDKKLRVIRAPLSDGLRDGIIYEPGVAEAYEALLARDPRRHEHADLATRLASAIDFEPGIDDSLPRVSAAFTREPFPFQAAGAIAVGLGRHLLIDPAGVGKTTTILATIDLLGLERAVIAVPPTLVPNWGREIIACGLDPNPSLFRAGRKHPAELSRVVVVPYSLLGRPAIAERLAAWGPQLLAADEAHNLKTLASARTQAFLDLAWHSERVVTASATPIISGPHELVPLLEASRLLAPVFGGADAFLQAYCTREPRHRKLSPRKRALSQLNELLSENASVRRRKEDVLPFLPERFKIAKLLEVDTVEYEQALEDTIQTVAERMEALLEQSRQDIAGGSNEDPLTLEDAVAFYLTRVGEMIAPLRVAAALLKVPDCVESVTETVRSNPGSPVMVWVHHQEVAAAAADGLAAQGLRVGRIVGGMSETAKMRVVDAYEASELDVVVASITAAGVGLTLTNGCEAFFLEADWTPALVSQAMDRQHRFGQERNVIATMLIALGTLDEHMQRVLEDKGTTASVIVGDEVDMVAVVEKNGLMTPKELASEIVHLAADRVRVPVAA